MRISKTICDKCKKDLDSKEVIKVHFNKKRFTGPKGYSNGYQKVTEVDLCEECSGELLTHLGQENIFENMEEA